MKRFLDQSLTAELVRSRLNYDPQTGAMTWKTHTKGHQHRVGKPAGRTGLDKKSGKLMCAIKINHTAYQTHRLAWLHYYGTHAEDTIDHIDGDRTNNSIANLRVVTHAQNMQNCVVRKRGCRNLPQGVAKLPGGRRFFARAQMNGVSTYIGTYDTQEQAHEAYKTHIDKVRGEFSPTHRL